MSNTNMKSVSRKNKLPECLKLLRSERGLTQQQVACGLNLNSVTYLRYEKGQREPSIDMLIAMATFFDVSVDYLIGFSDFY